MVLLQLSFNISVLLFHLQLSIQPNIKNVRWKFLLSDIIIYSGTFTTCIALKKLFISLIFPVRVHARARVCVLYLTYMRNN